MAAGSTPQVPCAAYMPRCTSVDRYYAAAVTGLLSNGHFEQNIGNDLACQHLLWFLTIIGQGYCASNILVSTNESMCMKTHAACALTHAMTVQLALAQVCSHTCMVCKDHIAAIL